MTALMTTLRSAWRRVADDQSVSQSIGGSDYRRRRAIVAFLAEPGLRAAFLMRVASLASSTNVRRFARARLLSAYSCDISAGAILEGGIYLPHPIGIVIGSGARIGHGARIYQNVTIGAGRTGYPTLARNVTVYPNSVLAGGITIGDNSRVGAGTYLDVDLAAGSTWRQGRPSVGSAQ